MNYPDIYISPDDDILAQAVVVKIPSLGIEVSKTIGDIFAIVEGNDYFFTTNERITSQAEVELIDRRFIKALELLKLRVQTTHEDEIILCFAQEIAGTKFICWQRDDSVAEWIESFNYILEKSEERRIKITLPEEQHDE